MSDLQVSLLIIGVVVVGGVVAFNWFQQWRLRRRLRRSVRATSVRRCPQPKPPRTAPRPVGTQTRSRSAPTGRRSGARGRARTAGGHQGRSAQLRSPSLPPLPDVDLAIDYVVALDAGEPISAAGLADLHTRAAATRTPLPCVRLRRGAQRVGRSRTVERRALPAPARRAATGEPHRPRGSCVAHGALRGCAGVRRALQGAGARAPTSRRHSRPPASSTRSAPMSTLRSA